MNELQNFLRTRRSIRRFLGPVAKTGKPDPLPAPVLGRILETAMYAPSAHNLQPWRFVIVQTETTRINLGKALTDKLRIDMDSDGATQNEIDTRVERSLRRINEAPQIILLCRDVTVIRKDEPEEHMMAVQSVALAGLQLMLAAHAEGVGANWICWPLYAQAETRDALNLPKTWEPLGMFFLGYANEEPKHKVLKALDEMVITI